MLLQNGDPLYRSAAEKAALQSEYENRRVEVLTNAYAAARYRGVELGGTQAAYDQAADELLNRKGLGFYRGGASDENLRLMRGNIPAADFLGKLRRAVDDATERGKAEFANLARRTVVMGLTAVGTAGAASGLGAAVAGVSSKLGFNIGGLGGAALAGAAPLALGTYDLLSSAARQRDAAAAQARGVEQRESEIAEGYAQQREQRELSRKYSDLLNAAKLDTIAKGARVSYSTPSLPKMSFNMRGAFARAKAQGISEGLI